MAIVQPGFAYYEQLAARQFEQSLTLALKIYGVDVQIVRGSIDDPEEEGIKISHMNAASQIYQLGAGLGKPDDVSSIGEETEADSPITAANIFDARIVASHHLYASADQDFLTDFESIYFFTQDDILPDDALIFIRKLDKLKRGFRVMEVELVGVSVSSTEITGHKSKRLKMTSLANPADSQVVDL